MTTSPRAAAAAADRSSPATLAMHRNEITIVGELAGPVEARTRSDGQEVAAFRVIARVGSAPDRRGGASPAPGQAEAMRRDVLDCVVALTSVRRRLDACRAGDVVHIDGSLRHRFWNGGGRVQSRYEIEVALLKRVGRRRRTTDRDPPG